MKTILTLLLVLGSLLSSIEVRSQSLNADSTKNYLRLSAIAPAVVLEHSFNSVFSLNTGVGLGYYIWRKNYYDYETMKESVFVIQSANVVYPLFRLNYPKSVTTVDQTTDEPDRKGRAVHEFIPFFDLEGRFYLNKKLRESKGKSIANNSANYLNLAGTFYSDGLQFYRLYYGLQRNMKLIWVDWSGGLGYSIGEFHSGIFLQGSLKMGLRLHKF